MAALGCLVMALAWYAASFGATRLLLRRTCWRQFSLEAPWLSGPALLVLVVSLAGFREPWELPAWQCWVLLAVGAGLSATVAVWDRCELLELVRARGVQQALILIPACVAGGIVLANWPGDPWDTVAIPRVSELADYAGLASVLTGHHQGEPGSPVCEFCRHHHTFRYGQDIVVAAVAQIAGRHPLQVIVPVTAFFRFQMVVLTGVLVFALVPPGRRGLAAAVVLLDAVLLVQLVFYANTFLSSNCTAPLLAAYFAWLALQQAISWREGVVVVLMNVFFLVTYPELLVIAKAFEALALVVAWRRGHVGVWQPLLACNVALLALHPLQVPGRILTVAGEMGGNGGWHLLGNPLSEPLHCLANLVGLRFGNATVEAGTVGSVLLWVTVPLALALVALDLVRLGRRYRVAIFLAAWLGLLTLMTVRCAMQGGYFYGPCKLLAHTYFVGVLACAAACVDCTGWQRRLANLGLGLWLGVAVWFTAALLQQRYDEPQAVGYRELCEALRGTQGRPVAILSPHRESVLVADMAAGDSGAGTAALTPFQRDQLKLHGLAHHDDRTRPAADGTRHDGLVLCERAVLDEGRVVVGGDTFRVECRRVVRQVGDFVLCEARVMACEDAPR